MKIALRDSQNKVSCKKANKPVLKQANDVLVKIVYTSICGSDIERVRSKDKKWNSIVLGHEAVGEVVDIGKDVKNLKIGSRVAIIPLIPCYSCHFCGEGNYSLCEDYSFIGSRINGTFAEYIVVDYKNLLKLPEDKDFEKYVFIEPLSISLHAIYKTKIKFGQTAAVLGTGTIGLLTFQILKNLGVCDVVITDIDQKKINIAKNLGASHIVNSKDGSLTNYIKNNIDRYGVDVTFESSGANAAKIDAIHITKPKGTIVLVGTSPNKINFSGKTFELITRKELNINGSWMSYSYPFPGLEWSTALKILKNNMLDVKQMVTHRYKLEEINAAFNMIFNSDQSYCKVIINM